MLGTIAGKRRREQQRIGWLESIINPVAMNLSKLGDHGGQRSLVCCSPSVGWQKVGHNLGTEEQQL